MRLWGGDIKEKPKLVEDSSVIVKLQGETAVFGHEIAREKRNSFL